MPLTGKGRDVVLFSAGVLMCVVLYFGSVFPRRTRRVWIEYSAKEITTVPSTGEQIETEDPLSQPEQWLSDGLQAGVNVHAIPSFEKPSYSSPEQFSQGSALAEGWWVELPGLLLLSAGMGLIVRGTKSAKERSVSTVAPT